MKQNKFARSLLFYTETLLNEHISQIIWYYLTFLKNKEEMIFNRSFEYIRKNFRNVVALV